MNESQMVVATKYKLTNPISLKSGTWDKEGSKQKVRTSVLLRSYVEDRNTHDNNELYVIDEEATLEMLKQREISIKENIKRDKRNKASFADLVEAVATPKESVKKQTKVEEDDSDEIEALKVELNEKGIKFHHKSGINKLRELNK